LGCYDIGFMFIAIDKILQGLKDYFLPLPYFHILELRGDKILKDIGIGIE